MNIQTALRRLNSQLPLKTRQEQLPADFKEAHRNILLTLVEQGRPPTRAELTQVLGEANVEAALQRLGADDLIVLETGGGLPVGAYPVTTEVTPHVLEVYGHSIYAMCAFDAVAVAPMFQTQVSIASSCVVTKEPINLRMQSSNLLDVQPGIEVSIGISWQMPTGTAAHSMCTEMVFLKDRVTAARWQEGDADARSLFDLPDAVAFAKAYFLPLLY